MKLRAIPTLTQEEIAEYSKIMESLKNTYGVGEFKSLRLDTIAEKHNLEKGYATNKYRGQLKEDIKISPLELSMMCDNGFSHFGGSSSISSDGSFYVEIYID